MNKFQNFIARHSSWSLIAAISLLLLYPTIAEFKTILMIFTFESLAIALSGVALFAYTKVDFINELSGGINEKTNIIGSIFLAVHLLVGFVVLGVYIAQFAN
jgi:hypothetical protein